MFPDVVERTLRLWRRLWLALTCAWQIIFDGGYAWRLSQLPVGGRTTPRARAPEAAVKASIKASINAEPQPLAALGERSRRGGPGSDHTSAQLLLGLLQRRGRLVDFLRQEIDGFDDADVAAAARLVHEGCRQALADVARIEPIRAEAEDSPIDLGADYDAAATKLTGQVSGDPPYHGVVRHRGWRVTELELPELVAGHDASVIAPAEVEL